MYPQWPHGDYEALGNIIYYLLAGHSPRGQTKAIRTQEQQNLKILGIPPPNTDPSIMAMRRALKKCNEADPKKRPTTMQQE